MKSLITALAEEHLEIETRLDQLATTLGAGQIDANQFREVAELNARHYRREDEFLARLQQHETSLAAKIKSQHAEALEIADRLNESLAAGETADVMYLARRFLAIAQHNIIEEERDVFPLARRIFSEED